MHALNMQPDSRINQAGSIGAVNNVPDLLASAGLLYRQASHQASLPNAALEAMASGLAVLATRVSGHEDVADHSNTRLRVEPSDPAALAAAMQALLDAPEERLRVGLATRAAIERTYCAEIISLRLLQLYRGADAA